LINFAAVGRIDLLESILRGRGRWTEAVEQEARKSGQYFPALSREMDWLGEPIEIDDPAETTQIEGIRRAVFGGTPGRPLQHLGEAQTCYLLRFRAEYRESLWLSDDREAIDYARRQGIVTRETWEIVAEAVTMGDVDADAGHQLLQDMASSGRGLRVPPKEHLLR
jgi:hypothetical protein